MGRITTLFSMDLEDIVRPPVYDALLIVSMILGGLYASILPRVSAVKLAIDVTSIPLFIAIIHLAVRGSAGIASLISNNVLQLYMAYPVSKRTLLTVMLITRVLVPSLLIVGAPLFVSSMLMVNVIAEKPLDVLIVFAGRIIYLYFIGVIFVLIALGAKRPMLAGALSIVFYFAYMFIGGILSVLSFVTGEEIYIHIMRSMMFSDTLNSYLIGMNIPYWTLIPVPVASILTTTLLYMYFTRRFEPT